MNKYCIDIDGTICNDAKGNYRSAKPYKERIARINKLYKDGHYIIYFTARGRTTGIDWSNFTKKQLREWGCKYHELRMGKPEANIFIDDKAMPFKDFFKNNKQAVVTGALGGIGKAITEVLHENGYSVELIDLKNGRDITNYRQMKKIFKKFKQVDVLVNCAGSNLNAHKTVVVNVLAPYELSRLAFPKMKNRGGSIINITSLWSERGFKNNPMYGISKGGLKMLTKCLAVEWAEYNIRVNNIGLGYFKTDMTKYSWDNRRSKITKSIPLGRWGNPEDIKEAIKFLINCPYITGQDLYLDGGWLASGGL